jgi:hypothetical protein
MASKHPRRPRWTIMVFMVGGPELGPSLSRDLLELERAGSSDDVSVVVAVHEPGSGTRFLRIMPKGEDGGVRAKRFGEPRGADPQERLDSFLDHVRVDFQADHYALILWGHASGLGFGSQMPEFQLRLSQLRKSLQRFLAAHKPEREKLEILGFCACAVSKAEFAVELTPAVRFLVSSQVGLSTLMTWPFDHILRRILLSPTVGAERFASYIVQLFEDQYEPPPVALTAVDLARAGDLRKVVEDLATAILDAFNTGDDDESRLNRLCVLNAFKRALEAYPYELESLVDFVDFCVKLLEEEDLDDRVRTMARKILDMTQSALIVNNARSGPKVAALNGLSILAPNFTDPAAEGLAAQSGGVVFEQWAKVSEEMISLAKELSIENPSR